MGTRSAIAIQTENGYDVVYCHWDGYPDHNGRILVNHYTERDKVRRLIDHGGMSSLGIDIGEKHDFNSSVDGSVCTFYGRDRGETGNEYVSISKLNDVLEKFSWCEYFYVYNLKNEWTCYSMRINGKLSRGSKLDRYKDKPFAKESN